MIHKLFALLIVVVVLIVGVTVYLSPNDLARCDKPDMSEQCRAADAIVVISGGDTTARTSEAIRLYQHGWAPRIIVSGAAADKSSLSNAEVMRQQVIASGVSADAVLVEEAVECGIPKFALQLLIERIRKIQTELPAHDDEMREEELAFTEAAEEQLIQTQAQRRYFYLRR